MYVQAFASTVDATHIGNNVTQVKPGVEFLTSSFVTLKAAMLLDTYKNFTVSPVVRTSALALYVINAWGCSLFGPCVAGDVMTLITKAVDEINFENPDFRYGPSGRSLWCGAYSRTIGSAIGRRRIHDDIGEERSGNGHSSLV
jgi:hypothetical protein